PLPLTAQGKLNADVDRNGVIQAYDAALILKHVAGLPMPAGVATCFEATDSPAVQFPAQVTFAISELRKDAQSTQLVVKCSGVDSSAGMIALSFDIGLASLSSTAALSALPDGYLAYVNQLNDGRVRVAVINPHGIAAKDIQMAITLGENEWLGGVRIDNVVLNNAPASGALLGVPPSAGTTQSFALVGAYPNPFNPSTRIVVDLPQRTSVRLEIYNAVGTRVRTLLNEPVGPGRHEIVWDGLNDSGQTVSSGQYFCRMRADAFTRTIRLMLLK
ncbi:MAG TPA: FlgD immunoglobulin-like domain containing protein, partial [Chloroflexota bacterium]